MSQEGRQREGEIKGATVYGWNRNEILPLEDGVVVAGIVKDSKYVIEIVTALLAEIASYKKECKGSWSMHWGKEDDDKAIALIKKLPKLDDTTVETLICADDSSWLYFIDVVTPAVAYDIVSGGKAKTCDFELALVKKLPQDKIDMKVYDGARFADAKKAINDAMSPELKKAAAEAADKTYRAICEKAKVAAKETFELGGFYLGMSYDDMKTVFARVFPAVEFKEAIDGDGADADYVIYVTGQRSPFCYAGVKDKKVYQFNFGKKLLKKWYNYDVQTPMEWASAYERENKIDMKFKMIDKEATVYEQDMSRSYNVWFHQESYQYKHNSKEYRLTYFGEEREFTVEGGLGGAIIKEMAAPKFRYVRGDVGSLRARIERD